MSHEKFIVTQAPLISEHRTQKFDDGRETLGSDVLVTSAPLSVSPSIGIRSMGGAEASSPAWPPGSQLGHWIQTAKCEWT